jgi:GPI mannosyltransferase 2
MVWPKEELSEAVMCMVVAHLSHWLSVVVLYKISHLVLRQQKLAFVAACLHIFSPAGLFLSTPYAESTFSLLSFFGYYLFAHGSLAGPSSIRGDVLQLLAGGVFGVSSLFRSNGVFNGILFVHEAVRNLGSFLSDPRVSTFRRLVFVGLGGLLVGAGSLGPQLVAYLMFCTEESPRPWCSRMIPSVYSYVQEVYWFVLIFGFLSFDDSDIRGRGVGLFKYWGVSTISMFVLAAPMTYILTRTGMDVLSESPDSADSKDAESRTVTERLRPFMQSLGVVQIILSVLAITCYHVQIITRLSAAYPLWYWCTARSLTDPAKSGAASGIIVFMTMYASIQGALFAFFLPPA